MLPSTRVSVISIFVQPAHKMHFIFSLNTTDPINFITLKKLIVFILFLFGLGWVVPFCATVLFGIALHWSGLLESCDGSILFVLISYTYLYFFSLQTSISLQLLKLIIY